MFVLCSRLKREGKRGFSKPKVVRVRWGIHPLAMSVYSVYVISESGSLQMYYDRTIPAIEVERTFTFPLSFVFENVDGRLAVVFGATDDIKLGYCVLAVNGVIANGTLLEDGRDISELFSNPSNFPITIRLGTPRLRPNDRITVASMFQAIHHMARVLTPTPSTAEVMGNSKSGAATEPSGIQTIETPEARIHCYESITGTKFLLITDARIPNTARDALKLVYEAYTDYVLKNPFYSPNQPFNFEFFNARLRRICDQVERGIYNVVNIIKVSPIGTYEKAALHKVNLLQKLNLRRSTLTLHFGQVAGLSIAEVCARERQPLTEVPTQSLCPLFVALWSALRTSTPITTSTNSCSCSVTMSQQCGVESRQLVTVAEENDAEHTEFESAAEIPTVTSETRRIQRSPLHLKNIVVKVPRVVVNGTTSRDSCSRCNGEPTRIVTVERTAVPTSTVEVQTEAGSRVLLPPVFRVVEERTQSEKSVTEEHFVSGNPEGLTRNNCVNAVSYQPVYSRTQTWGSPQVQETTVDLLRSGYTPYEEVVTRVVRNPRTGSYIVGYEPTLYRRYDVKVPSVSRSNLSSLGSERLVTLAQRSAVVEASGADSTHKDDSSSCSNGSDNTLVERSARIGTRELANDVVYLRKTRVPRNVLVPCTTENRDVLFLRRSNVPVERTVRVERSCPRTQCGCTRLRHTENLKTRTGKALQ
ncbi:Trafficking protein particle complex subunit 4 [Echinococcus granulosus]|uniref:Trafficking protein particle complex subunit 4 n=1 Tax=Echinococcus granulosus TaxID=6210 RepID=W6UR04_ECHGR|nr:Trafficking protein particle complex subunit 4 [Echinococcus granulosus]EUB60747.1 Trafficking protein particle complex subunit 4 [Echinococcus granulosus]